MRTQKYDLVFTDIKMPGMDGVELAEHVKASQPWTPVVIITGYGTIANEARAKAVGVSDFMRKPLSPEMIEESAAHALLEPAPTIVAKRQARPVGSFTAPWVNDQGIFLRLDLHAGSNLSASDQLQPMVFELGRSAIRHDYLVTTSLYLLCS